MYNVFLERNINWIMIKHYEMFHILKHMSRKVMHRELLYKPKDA